MAFLPVFLVLAFVSFEATTGLPSAFDDLHDLMELPHLVMPTNSWDQFAFNEPPPPPTPPPAAPAHKVERREAEEGDEMTDDDEWFDLLGLNDDAEDYEDEVAWNPESDLDWAEEATLMAVMAPDQEDDGALSEEEFFYGE